MTKKYIRGLVTVNDVEENKVEEIAKSIRENGWQGAPIIYAGETLITGSHRYAALDKLYNDADFEDEHGVFENENVMFDAEEIIEAYLKENEMDFDEIDFSYLGEVFEGTEVDRWKSEIAEW